MLLLPASDPRQQRPSPIPPEALIREARRRTGRRRLRVAAVLVMIAGLAVAAYALLARSALGVFRPTASSPYANARAFSGHGELAFVSRGQMWVLDGATGTLRELRVPAGDEADYPSFSHDGRWLAYAVEPTDPNYHGTFQLWIAHGDGTGAYRVRGVRLVGMVGWSPRADLLAATTGQHLNGVPYGPPAALMLVAPHRRPRTLVSGSSRLPVTGTGAAVAYTAIWSPSGNALAVSVQRNQNSAIETVPVAAGGRPTLWLAEHGTQPVPIAGVSGRVIYLEPELAGWWPHWGIAFWLIDGGADQSRDSTQLVVMRRPGAKPHFVANTLALGMSKELAPGPAGKLALVASTNNFGREFGAGKTVEICTSIAVRCAAVPGAASWPGSYRQRCPCFPTQVTPGKPGSGVSEDPSWSPNGSELAYEKAPAVDNTAWPDNLWFADHALYVWNARTETTRRIGNVNGSALPGWSGDGRDLMYESGDGLWLMPVKTGKPIELVHPLYAQRAWNNKISHLASISYYGQIPWQSQFAWWSPPR